MGCDGGYYPVRLDPCPVCKVRQGFMAQSWRSYQGLACSEECAIAASAAIDRVRQSPIYKAAQRRKRDAEQAIATMEWNAVRRTGPGVKNVDAEQTPSAKEE